MGVKGLKSVLREIFPNFAGLDILDLSVAVSLQSRNFDGKTEPKRNRCWWHYGLQFKPKFSFLSSWFHSHSRHCVFFSEEHSLTRTWDWNIKLGTVHLAFPCSAVSEPTLITVHRWKPTVLSPPLQEHEALVSNVIEISSNSREAFKFEAEVKMSFTHSSPGLHGYELVLYKRIDNETGAWEEMTNVEDFKTISGWRKSLQIC